jgi:aminopeptidase
MNIENGNDLPEEELIAQGYNKSMVHVDFMFGSHDMEIDGITYDGNIVPVFRKGNFVF